MTVTKVYGDVQRVKIFFHKRDTALVQFAYPQQAYVPCFSIATLHLLGPISFNRYVALMHLNRVDMFGKSMSISPSKHPFVSLPLHMRRERAAKERGMWLVSKPSHVMDAVDRPGRGIEE